MRVPVYERQSTSLRGGDTVPKASDEAFGAAQGRATSALGVSLGNAITSIGDALEKNQNENDAITAKIEDANHEARVQQKYMQLQNELPPERSSELPALITEFHDQSARQAASAMSGRYQRQFAVSATRTRNYFGLKATADGAKRSFDYEGTRVTKAANEMSVFLEDDPSPESITQKTAAMRSIIDEMKDVPEWKKDEIRGQIGLQMHNSIVQGYLKRDDPQGAREAKDQMRTMLPKMLGHSGGAPTGPVKGLLEPGNIDLSKRPQVKNKDGTTSTVLSMSFNEDGKEVLIPRVVGDKILSPKEAIENYRQTGEHLGKFKTPAEATGYAERLHTTQENFYANRPKAVISPADRHNVIMTIIGEAQDQDENGKAGVAAVIRNRLLSGKWGRTATDVVLSKGQFEAWNRDDARARMDKVKPTDKEYQDIGVIVDKMFNGQMPDPSKGATDYYSPKVQGELGRPPPKWASQYVKVASLGTHDFFVRPGASNPTPSVIEMQGEVAGIRKQPIKPELKGQLQLAANHAGVVVEVTSGGQPSRGTQGVDRTGSHRHDEGGAADVQLRDAATGKLLDMRVPEDKARMATFVAASVAAGATGVGAGEGYMGNHRIHVGGGSEAHWGGSDWIGQAREQGRSGGIKLASNSSLLPQSLGAQDDWAKLDDAQERQIKAKEGEIAQKRKTQNTMTDAALISEQYSIRDQGDAGRNPKLTTELLNSSYEPARVNLIEKQRASDMAYFGATRGWEMKSEQEIAADLETINPANSVADEAYKYKTDNYDNAIKYRDKIMQQRKASIESAKTAAAQEVLARARPDDQRKPGQPPLTREWLDSVKHLLTADQYGNGLDMVYATGAKHNDEDTLTELTMMIGREPEGFVEGAIQRAMRQKLIKGETARTLLNENRAKQPKEDERFVENSLDPGMFSGTAHSLFKQSQATALQEHRLWKQQNREATQDEIFQNALDTVKRYQPYDKMTMTMGIPKYFGVTTRQEITPQVIEKAKLKLQDDINNGKLSGAQIVIENDNLKNWAAAITHEMNAGTAAQGAADKAKPRAGRFGASTPAPPPAAKTSPNANPTALNSPAINAPPGGPVKPVDPPQGFPSWVDWQFKSILIPGYTGGDDAR